MEPYDRRQTETHWSLPFVDAASTIGARIREWASSAIVASERARTGAIDSAGTGTWLTATIAGFDGKTG